LSYRVEVMNAADSTAAAHTVTLRHRFADPDRFDFETLELTRVAILDREWSGTEVAAANGRLDLRSERDLVVDVRMATDWEDADADGIHWQWELGGMAATTAGTPQEIPAAILRPRDPGSAERQDAVWFEFRVKPRAALASGTQLGLQAFAEFNRENDWQDHPAPVGGPWTNAVDADPPISQVAELPEISPANFDVRWAGRDDLQGSGVDHYDIYVSVDERPFERWLEHTTDTAARFAGMPGRTYRFYSVATDLTGQVEPAPGRPDATTSVPGAGWTNPVDRLDVDGDGQVAPIDVLLIVNYVNASSPDLPLPAAAEAPPFLDVNGDGFAAPIDALLVINALNQRNDARDLPVSPVPELDEPKTAPG
jgi:hypothetical protein